MERGVYLSTKRKPKLTRSYKNSRLSLLLSGIVILQATFQVDSQDARFFHRDCRH